MLWFFESFKEHMKKFFSSFKEHMVLFPAFPGFICVPITLGGVELHRRLYTRAREADTVITGTGTQSHTEGKQLTACNGTDWPLRALRQHNKLNLVRRQRPGRGQLLQEARVHAGRWVCPSPEAQASARWASCPVYRFRR